MSNDLSGEEEYLAMCIRVKGWCGRIGTLASEPTLCKTEDGIPIHYECRVRWDGDERSSYAIWHRLDPLTEDDEE